jgi:CO/xanthine dehydrogenase FAD-binding subunit
MKYYSPTNLDEIIVLLDKTREEGAVILAGGTDVVPKIISAPERSGFYDRPSKAPKGKSIIYIGNAGLNYIREEGNDIVIGAGTTMTAFLENDLSKKLPVLCDAINNLAGLTIRNVATIGGNIINASPACDTVPALIALEAKVVIKGLSGERTERIEDIFVDPGATNLSNVEVLKEIVVSVPAGKGEFIKLGRRKAETLAVVNCAAQAVMDAGKCEKIRIAIGSVAPTPLRLVEIEKMIEGNAVTDELIESAAKKVKNFISPIDDNRSTAAYREQMAEVIIKRAIQAVCQ